MNCRIKPKLLWFILPVILLAACSPIATQGQTSYTSIAYRISAQTSVGQTLTSRHNGLLGLQVYLSLLEPAAGSLRLAVYDTPEKTASIAAGSLSLESVSTDGFYTILLDTPLASYMQDFYIEFSTNSQAVLAVGSAGPEVYEDGTLYQNKTPQPAQLTFQPVYQPGPLVWGLIRQALIWLLWLLAGAFLFILPGYALLKILYPQNRSWPVLIQLAGSSAASLSVYPLLMSVTRLVALQLGAWYAYLPAAAATLYLLIHWLRSGRPMPRMNIRQAFQPDHLVSYAALAVILVIIFTRFWAIRAIPLPMWGDTIHHTMIVQLMLDNGGLFDSWQPYAELQSMNYHFGFHAATAVFAWLTGLPSTQATLITGQLANILAVLAVFGLAWKTGRGSRWAGTIAITLAGVVSFMPMFYVNWSRYTQLSGQIILPFVVFFLWELFESPRFHWKPPLLAGFLAAGLALTHYRIFIFFLAAVPVLLLLYLRKTNFRATLATLFTAGASGALLFLPWFFHVYSGRLFANFSNQVTTPVTPLGDVSTSSNLIDPLTSYLPVGLWIIFALAIAWSLWRRERGMLLLGGWWLTILILANPALVRLPGTGILSNFAVFIAMYIPASILIGSAVAGLVQAILIRRPQQVQIFLLLLILFTADLAGKDRLQDARPTQFALASRPDLRAAAWIRANTPPESRVLVNSFFAYRGSTVVGSDAGWWLPVLTGRQISIPPMIYGSEQGPSPDYPQYINQLRALIEEKGYTHPDVIAELNARGIRYAFIGQKNGRVNYAGPIILNAEELIASDAYRPVYHQDGVWLFEVAQNP